MEIFEFSNLFRKISRSEFLERYHDKAFYHEPGAIEDLSSVFSWDGVNDLFNRPKLWNAETMELAINGQVLAPTLYCRPAMGRLGDRILRPDREKVNHFLRKGATLVLDYLEGIHPGVRKVTNCIERLTGTATSANAYCSWQSVQGYSSHFDTMCVFAIQIEGEKAWNIYNGRVNEPMAIPGARPSDFSREQHDKQKGSVARKVVMRPGDVLYLPRGLYHDAIATETASLHLSFGATYLAGFSAVSLLIHELQREEFFRRRLPHFDDGEALSGFLREVGEQVAARMADGGFHRRVATHMLDNLSDKMADHRLPARNADQCFLVTRREPRLVRRGQDWRLELGDAQITLAAALAPMVRHVLSRELVWISELLSLTKRPEAEVVDLLREMERHALIWPIAA